MANRMGVSTCAVCGEMILPGSAVALHYGAGGRVHVLCIPPGKVMTVADGSTYQRPVGRGGRVGNGISDANRIEVRP